MLTTPRHPRTASALLSLALLGLLCAPAQADRPPRYAWSLPAASESSTVTAHVVTPIRPPRRHAFPLLRHESSVTPVGSVAGDDALRGLDLRVAPNAPAERVVLISMDGLRYDALSPRETPVLAWLMRHGLTATRATTLRRSLTLPSHTSMMTGVGIAQHGLGYNSYHLIRGRSRFPSIFRVAHAAGVETSFFVAKEKLSQLLQPGDIDHYEQGGILCDQVNARALPHLRQMDSGLAFVHYPDPDGAGHRDGWMSPNYHRAVRRVDRCLSDVLTALSTRGFARTLVIVTADHGGHGHTHGTASRIDRHIPWIAFGGVVRPGEIRELRTLDTAPTILRALGLPVPHGVEGRAIEAAFAQRRPHAPRWQPVVATTRP